jgi:hypothetical protein
MGGRRVKYVRRAKVFEDVLDEIKADEISWSKKVRVGDYVDAQEDAFFLSSNVRYKTKGKLYRVKEVDIRSENGKVYSRTVIVDSDVEGERMWLGPERVIVRNGRIVWESSIQKGLNALSKADKAKMVDLLYTPIIP